MKIFSVVVTFNAGKWIEKCLTSLFDSSIKTEIIVIDNQSTDDTVSIIETRFSEVRLIRNSENKGFGKANNQGILLAYNENADFVFLLNQDAWVEPGTIEVLAEKMRANPEYGILSPLQFFDNNNLDKKFKSYIKSSAVSNYATLSASEKEQIFDVRFVNAAVWLVSRECIAKTGLFAPVFSHYGEDLNYAHRCSFHKIKTGISPVVRAFHERPQEKPSEKNIKIRQLIERDRNYCFGVLLNLKHSYYRQWLFLFFIGLKNVFLSAIQLRFKTIAVILLRTRIAFKFWDLLEIREVTKQPGAFLN